EHQDRVDGMDPETRRVMPRGCRAVELPVEHVGHPRERMPVVRPLAGGPCPMDRLGIETTLHVRIRGDVLVVVEVDEIAAENGPERRDDADYEKGRDEQTRRRTVGGCGLDLACDPGIVPPLPISPAGSTHP